MSVLTTLQQPRISAADDYIDFLRRKLCKRTNAAAIIPQEFFDAWIQTRDPVEGNTSSEDSNSSREKSNLVYGMRSVIIVGLIRKQLVYVTCIFSYSGHGTISNDFDKIK